MRESKASFQQTLIGYNDFTLTKVEGEEIINSFIEHFKFHRSAKLIIMGGGGQVWISMVLMRLAYQMEVPVHISHARSMGVCWAYYLGALTIDPGCKFMQHGFCPIDTDANYAETVKRMYAEIAGYGDCMDVKRFFATDQTVFPSTLNAPRPDLYWSDISKLVFRDIKAIDQGASF